MTPASRKAWDRFSWWQGDGRLRGGLPELSLRIAPLAWQKLLLQAENARAGALASC